MTNRPTLQRHTLIFTLCFVATYALLFSRAEWSAMHRFNRALGDLSLVLVALAMVIGPLTRLSSARVFRKMLPYRRELGIYAVIAAIIHTVIILIGWVQLDFARLFGFEFHPQLQEYVMVQEGFALGNLIGIAALLYGIVLAVTSNDFSQKRLGTSVWKYIQQGAYVLWWLVVLHTAYFLFFHFLDFHRQTPEPNWAQWPFIILVGVVLLLQTAATLVTWRSQRQRRPSSVGAE
jgi:sulfoxide reductase heme-binding subunit YedZ